MKKSNVRLIFNALLATTLLISPVWGITAEEADNTDRAGLSENLVMGVYRPLHSAFADSAQDWASEVSDLCERRPASSAYKMQFRFAKLIELYSAIELYRVGPLLEDNLQNRIFYWPDKRSVGQRQLRNLMASLDDQKMTVEALVQKSVAVQGFAALERLLFQSEFQTIESAPQCSLIIVIINNIATMARELDTAWQSDSGFIQSLLEPHADSEHFRDSEEVLRSAYTQVKVGLDVVLDGKLRLLLSNDEKMMRQTPLWVSQRTVSMLMGNLKGLRALLLDSGMLAETRYEEELHLEFDYIEHVLSELRPMVYFVENDGTLKPEIKMLMNKLAAVVAGVRFTVNTDVSRDLGISAGFNSEDGD
ncbi:MAG: imelysin family protein [Granulosicoccus sp.]